MVININSVYKKFNDLLVLKDISFFVEEGEIFGLLGPSGAGKTTLINIITGQLEPTSGEVKIWGVNSKNFGEDIYKKIGMLLEIPGLYDRLNVVQNLKIYAKIHNIPHNEIGKVLELVNLEPTKKPVSRLSNGMKQRLLIARALLHNPKILFLDEPTSALDPVNARNIHNILFDLKQKGITIFMTTHNMEEAEKLCDRVALLNEGCICACDSPFNLSKKFYKDRKINLIKNNGEKISLDFSSENIRNIYNLIKNEDIFSIHSTEPNLEDIFIKLTGRKLYDES